MFVPLFLCVLGAVIATLVLPKRYMSMTLILVETKEVPDSVVPKLVTQNAKKRLTTISQQILSRTRLERVVRDVDPYPQDPHGRPQPLSVLVDRARAATMVKVKGDDAFSIEFTHDDPKKAQAVTERLATLFIESTEEERARQVEDTHQFVEAQVAAAREQLDRKEEELRRYKERYMGTLPEQLPANLSTLQRLQLEQQTVEQTIRGLNERQTLIQTSLSDPAYLTGPAGSGETPTSPAAQLALLRSQLADLRSRYTNQHPDVRATLDRIARLEAQLSAQPGTTDAPMIDEGRADPLREQLQDAQAELVQLKAKRADLERQVQLFQSRVERTPRAEQELMAMQRDHDKLQQNYLELVQTRMNATLAENLEKRWRGVDFKVLDPANLPERPVFPNPFQFVVVGLVLGLLVGFGACYAAEKLDRSIKSVGDLQALFNCPVLAVVSHVEPLTLGPGPAVVDLGDRVDGPLA
jgi:polysaccharide chain length determinant protein (PEP-CTERM system associated)